MVEERDGDLLGQLDLTHILHQCNLYCTFGSGLALAIKKKYPEAYEADVLTGKGDWKLGTWSYGKGIDGKYIINLYSQTGISATDRVTSYDAMVKGLYDIRNALSQIPTEVKLGIPYKLGCGLANGSWAIVNAILHDIFDKSMLTAIICKRPGD